MDYISLFLNLLLVIGYGSGFVYGLHKCLTVRKLLYFQMITAAVGCSAVTRLYNVVSLLCMGGYGSGFNVGLVGPISCFSLLFCAEFGAIDSLVDETERNSKKIKLLAWIFPAVLTAASACILATPDMDLTYRIFISCTLVVIISASYFDFKHLILHRTGNEIFAALRGYYLLALAMELLTILELLFLVYGLQLPFMVTIGLLFVISLAILPVLNKGVAKWTI